MRRVFGIAVVAILIALPGFAQTIQIDYAHDFDFEGATTFQYAVNEESGIKDNAMMADRVVDLIKKELREGGLREVQQDPDLYVTYHFTSEEQKSLSTYLVGFWRLRRLWRLRGWLGRLGRV